ncbi:MAG: 16S rRNA (guanine(527)-N(7))-methyltransferase RsmG, partial [Acidobacteriota bacterium]
MPTPTERFSRALYDHAGDFGIELQPEGVKRLSDYYELLLKWNSKLHLVAPCSPEVFATRHILESLILLPHLSRNARVIDVGSGAGLPIIPCLIVREDLRAILIESSQKKAVFLREALRCANSRERAHVIAARFEHTEVPEADFVTCRALDRFQTTLPALIDWAPSGSGLLFFAGRDLLDQIKMRVPSAKVFPIP